MPDPRRSYRIRRPIDDRRSKKRATVGCSHRPSIAENDCGT
jgi:hypothetical protein